MNVQANHKEIWFIYDGECPLCKSAALALRIKQDYGTLHLLNAREELHQLIEQVNARGLSLDEGMVIVDGESFYHGKDALIFMARYGDNKGLFNRGNKWLFRSASVAAFLYPIMRSVRNVLLKLRRVSLINNLSPEATSKSSPIFKSIFSAAWSDLPPVMHKHYANRPYTDDVTIVRGMMDVSCSGPIKMFAPLLRFMGSVPPFNETDVPVVVRFESEPTSKAFHFKREFQFKNRKPYYFNSYMLQRGDEVIEVMRFGLVWRTVYIWEIDRVKLKHKGYAIKLFGFLIPLPLTLLLGEGNAQEIPVDDNTFDMRVEMTHPLWGLIYEYKGRFEVIKLP